MNPLCQEPVIYVTVTVSMSQEWGRHEGRGVVDPWRMESFRCSNENDYAELHVERAQTSLILAGKNLIPSSF